MVWLRKCEHPWVIQIQYRAFRMHNSVYHHSWMVFALDRFGHSRWLDQHWSQSMTAIEPLSASISNLRVGRSASVDYVLYLVLSLYYFDSLDTETTVMQGSSNKQGREWFDIPNHKGSLCLVDIECILLYISFITVYDWPFFKGLESTVGGQQLSTVKRAGWGGFFFLRNGPWNIKNVWTVFGPHNTPPSLPSDLCLYSSTVRQLSIMVDRITLSTLTV